MLTDIFFALWFFLPAGIANAIPIVAAKLPGIGHLDAPMDFGKQFRGKRIFGSHKTWRGMITGIIAATIVLWLQVVLVGQWEWLARLTEQVDYAEVPVLIMGPLFAIGALGGDAVKSFFKRQVGVAPGRSWFPFDQIDYIVGGAIATMGFVSLSFWQYAWLLIVWLVAHLISSYVGYLMHLKERPI